MPLYEFRCKCGKVTERILPANQSKYIECPFCLRRAKNVGIYKIHAITDTGPGTTWIAGTSSEYDPDTGHRSDSPGAVLCDMFDPKIETRSDLKRAIERKGVNAVG